MNITGSVIDPSLDTQADVTDSECLFAVISEWLDETVTQNTASRYTHRLFRERAAQQSQARKQIQQRLEQGHADMIRHLRALAQDTLDPLGAKTVDPAYGYPWRLPHKTLKGYFGEVFAAVVAQEVSHFGIEGWKVPVYPFRLHLTAYRYLVRLQRGENPKGTIPGRDGDDMLAFIRDENGRILKSLVCEAKCTNTHDSGLIVKAHEQVSAESLIPIDILPLVGLLRDYDDDESKSWRKALVTLFHTNGDSNYERCDLVCYVCGQSPVVEQAWMDASTPHSNYKAKRRLEVVEIHLISVDQLITETYDAMARKTDGISR